MVEDLTIIQKLLFLQFKSIPRAKKKNARPMRWTPLVVFLRSVIFCLKIEILAIACIVLFFKIIALCFDKKLS